LGVLSLILLSSKEKLLEENKSEILSNNEKPKKLYFQSSNAVKVNEILILIFKYIWKKSLIERKKNI